MDYYCVLDRNDTTAKFKARNNNPLILDWIKDTIKYLHWSHLHMIVVLRKCHFIISMVIRAAPLLHQFPVITVIHDRQHAQPHVIVINHKYCMQQQVGTNMVIILNHVYDALIFVFAIKCYRLCCNVVIARYNDTMCGIADGYRYISFLCWYSRL